MTNRSAITTWGTLSGEIYYSTGFMHRGKSLWTCPPGAPRSDLRPIIEFKVKQTGRWNTCFDAASLSGDFSFSLEAINPPLVGLPNFGGIVATSSQTVADIACQNNPTRILSIR